MKYFSTLLLIVFSFFFIEEANSQIYTGPNQKICKGSCVILGKAPVANYCYKWMNQSLETISTSSTITVCPEETQNYYLNVTDQKGDLIVKEEVEVSVIDAVLNLTVYDAKVTFSQTEEYQAVSEEEEESIGAQTFVNLDNDDGDEYFDNDDANVIASGDDELIRLEISSSAKSIILQAVQGEDYIKIFKTEMKDGSYDLGTTFFLEEDSDGLYKGELWVEGLKPHTEQKATILELMTLEGELSCTDKVAITILGIKKISWNGKGNGFKEPFHDSDILDIDPSFPTGELKGYRVFSGARIEDVKKPRDWVVFKVALTVKPVRNVRLYVRTFDIDDPSTDIKFIDPNDEGGNGEYPGEAGLEYDIDNDNRGFALGYKFGFMNSQDNNGIKTLFFNPTTNISIQKFKVSHYAGDNYRLVANGDRDFIVKLRNADVLDGMDIVHPKSGVVQNESDYTSPVLTVWRLLHIESESMLNFEYGLYTQQIFTYVTNFVSLEGVNQATSIGVVAVETDLTNPTGSMVDSSVGFGRFENGYVIFAPNSYSGGGGQIFPGLIKENEANSIEFESTLNLAGLFGEITNATGTVTTDVTINNIIKISAGGNTTFEWDLMLPSGFNLLNFAGGTIRFGSELTAIEMDITEIQNNTSCITEELFIPVIIRDDDQSPEDNVLPQKHEELASDFKVLKKALREAYVLPVVDGAGVENKNELSFIENITTDDYTGKLKEVNHSKTNETQYFWASYLAAAWQADYDVDKDPNDEKYVPVGQTYATVHNTNLSKGGDISIYLKEVIKDAQVPNNYKQSIIAHEIGHQFGLDHGDTGADLDGDGLYDGDPNVPEYPAMGLMGVYSTEISMFIPRHINLIRSRKLSPGQEE